MNFLLSHKQKIALGFSFCSPLCAGQLSPQFCCGCHLTTIHGGLVSRSFPRHTWGSLTLIIELPPPPFPQEKAKHRSGRRGRDANDQEGGTGVPHAVQPFRGRRRELLERSPMQLSRPVVGFGFVDSSSCIMDSM